MTGMKLVAIVVAMLGTGFGVGRTTSWPDERMYLKQSCRSEPYQRSPHFRASAQKLRGLQLSSVKVARGSYEKAGSYLTNHARPVIEYALAIPFVDEFAGELSQASKPDCLMIAIGMKESIGSAQQPHYRLQIYRWLDANEFIYFFEVQQGRITLSKAAYRYNGL